MDVHLFNWWWLVAWDHWIKFFGHSDGLLPTTGSFLWGSKVVLWILHSHSNGYPFGLCGCFCHVMVPTGILVVIRDSWDGFMVDVAWVFKF